MSPPFELIQVAYNLVKKSINEETFAQQLPPGAVWTVSICKWRSVPRYPSNWSNWSNWSNCLCGDNASAIDATLSPVAFFFDLVSPNGTKLYISSPDVLMRHGDHGAHIDLWRWPMKLMATNLQISSVQSVHHRPFAEECLIDDLIEWMRILEWIFHDIPNYSC